MIRANSFRLNIPIKCQERHGRRFAIACGCEQFGLEHETTLGDLVWWPFMVLAFSVASLGHSSVLLWFETDNPGYTNLLFHDRTDALHDRILRDGLCF